MSAQGDELSDAVLEVLTDQSLTLAQLVDKLRENERWRRVDPRLVKAQLQKLEESYHVLHERDGAAVRYRWFSPNDAQIIAQRNDRRRKFRTTKVEMLIREGLHSALRAESLIMVRIVPGGGIMPLSPDEDDAARSSIARAIAAHVEAAPATTPRRNPE